jgi:hypothetical protein
VQQEVNSMNFDKPWTSFAVEAEAQEFGVARLVRSHNELMTRVKQLEMDRATLLEQMKYFAIANPDKWPVKRSEFQHLVQSRAAYIVKVMEEGYDG